MSRTNHRQRKEKRSNREYMSGRLSPFGDPVSKYTKKRTHRLERRRGKKGLNNDD